MMIGLDCNILVQLAFADHPANAKALAAVQKETSQGTKLVFPSLVVNEFLHVVTDPRRFAPPLTMTQALDWIAEFLADPMVELLESSKLSTAQTLLWMREYSLGRKRILDTHLAAVLHTSGVKRLLTGNSADFAIFKILEISTP
jgi:toxin-antitoxin system PIN domain toxin